MSWQPLTSAAQWQEIMNASAQTPQVVFKHSTRCSISAMALRRFEDSELYEKNLLNCWYLDLIEYRAISDLIATETRVKHESPQCIVIKNQEVIYAESHGMIAADEILQILKIS
ncbi:MAG: hypothetical protein RLZZ65_1468 [Bacteroidota bacterium]|jgi:bacillithiol system protein YtxJ